MLRDDLKDALKSAMKSKDSLAVSTLRLILAAIKDRDIAARGKGETEGIGEPEITGVLQTMIRQRREAIDAYRQGGRTELAEREAGEIEIIERFLPAQMDESEVASAVDGVIAEIGAGAMQDMGRTMTVLKERYAGRMDFAKASAFAKDRLSAA